VPKVKAKKCTIAKKDGTPCGAWAKDAGALCRWHDQSNAARMAHLAQSSAGGLAKAWAHTATTSPLQDDATVGALDLNTATGIRGLLAASLRALTREPHSAKVAATIAQLVSAQRAVIVESDIEREMREVKAALEQMKHYKKSA